MARRRHGRAAAIAVVLTITAGGAAGDDGPEVGPMCRDAGDLGFTGGTGAPAQLHGSFGPGTVRHWDVGKGAATGEATDLELVTAVPNGTTTILWGAGPMSPGEGMMTVECSTGWGCMDDGEPAKGWESGVIFNAAFADGADIVFCHMFERTTRAIDGVERETLLMWETGWTLGERHTCPATLRDALAGIGSYDGDIAYMEVPHTGRGAPLVERTRWTCTGARGGVISIVNDD